MSTQTLPCVVVEPQAAASFAVIWLHGLGADGHDFEGLVPYLDLPPTTAIRFVFPHAPYRAITINGGARMRAWYDITELASLEREDRAGLRASAQAVTGLIEQQIGQGITPERIVLAGFSQGGAVALQAGLRYPRRLGGILALSTYVPLRDTLPSEVHPANRAVPILMAHGSDDEIIPLALAERSRRLLEQLGYAVEWHTFPMGHAVSPEEVQVISGWLRDRATGRG